ncbi:MAG: cell division protein FtsQ [Francisellaceae bacterium]|nr:cell division protein FtsQ [Francisellaceae bacterium]
MIKNPIINLCLSLFLVSLILFGLIQTISYVKRPDIFPVQIVEVHGALRHTTEEEIKESLISQVQSGFFGLEIEKVKSQLMKSPWIAHIKVKRAWPDKLIIKLSEYQPLAQFGNNSVIATEGHIIGITDLQKLPSYLPYFQGPHFRAKEMVTQYSTISEALQSIGLHLNHLILSEEGTWQFILDNGLKVVLGKQSIAERLGRFIKIYQKNINPYNHLMNYIDLRYTNGLAIGWKAGVNRPIMSNVS